MYLHLAEGGARKEPARGEEGGDRRASAAANDKPDRPDTTARSHDATTTTHRQTAATRPARRPRQEAEQPGRQPRQATKTRRPTSHDKQPRDDTTSSHDTTGSHGRESARADRHGGTQAHMPADASTNACTTHDPEARRDPSRRDPRGAPARDARRTSNAEDVAPPPRAGPSRGATRRETHAVAPLARAGPSRGAARREAQECGRRPARPARPPARGPGAGAKFVPAHNAAQASARAYDGVGRPPQISAAPIASRTRRCPHPLDKGCGTPRAVQPGGASLSRRAGRQGCKYPQPMHAGAPRGGDARGTRTPRETGEACGGAAVM